MTEKSCYFDGFGGSQFRKPSISIQSNIVGKTEGGSKNIYIRLLTYSLIFADETRDHLETLFIEISVQQTGATKKPVKRLNNAGRKLYTIIKNREPQSTE